MRLVASGVMVACFWVPPAAAQNLPPVPPAPCAWRPPVTQMTVRVRSVDDIHRALVRARPGTTILVEPGDYRLDRTINLGLPDIVIRGATGDPADVVLRGAGMLERQVGVAIAVNVSDVVIADLTIRDVGYHGIQVRGENGVSRVRIQDVRIVDTGQQLLKGSTGGGAPHSDAVVIACSTFEYTNHAPSNYTNGVDVLGGTNWVVRDNRFLRIRGPATERFAAGPAILFWANSSGTQVERNVIVDSFRGIAFGLGPGASGTLARDGEPLFDHQGGWIRNNVVVSLNPWADEGIEANAARSVDIDYNTVLTSGEIPWALSLRFPRTTARARNNLTSKPLIHRDGGQGSVAGHVSGAAADWFVDAAAANLRLAHAHVPAVDAGVPVTEVLVDAAGAPRETAAPDAGAFEYLKLAPGPGSALTVH